MVPSSHAERGTRNAERTPELDARQRAIADELDLGDWMLAFQHVVEQGATTGLADADRTDERLVRGCQSRVWLKTWTDAGADRAPRFRLAADSEAAIVKGLAALLVRVFDGLPPRDAATAELWFARESALAEHLSPNRANGLAAMTAQIRREAARWASSPGTESQDGA